MNDNFVGVLTFTDLFHAALCSETQYEHVTKGHFRKFGYQFPEEELINSYSQLSGHTMLLL